VATFDKPVENDPGNPYGIDFVILGNAFEGSAEPGIVRVMRDDNANGLPDDTWYELWGSYHHYGAIRRNYAVEYLRPADTLAAIPWTDSHGGSGLLKRNSFFTQNYFPSATLFPSAGASMVFTGNLLPHYVEVKGGVIFSRNYLFGYADNTPVVPGGAWLKPDNPYTPDLVEGMGGDAFDISWACDSLGKPVVLPEVHFILVYNAVNLQAGMLGEISTDVAGIVDIPPDPALTGNAKLISFETLPEKTLARSQFDLRALVFNMGIPHQESLSWNSSDTSVLEITGAGIAMPKKAGTVEVTAFAPNAGISGTTILRCIEPGEIVISGNTSGLRTGDIREFTVTLTDNTGEPIQGVYPGVSLPDTVVFKVLSYEGGKLKLQAKAPGESGIFLGIPGWAESDRYISVTVEPTPATIGVFFLAKAGELNLIPRKPYTVQGMDANLFTDRGQVQQSPDFISLAEVISEIMVTNGFSGGSKTFRFRADEYSGDKLYLWQMGNNWEFLYGWGGSTTEPYRSAWAVVLNDTLVVNSLDRIAVNHGDVISLLHLQDIGQPFTNYTLLPEKYVSLAGEAIEFSIRKQTWILSESGPFVCTSGEFQTGSLLSLQALSSGSGTKSMQTVENPVRFSTAGSFAVSIPAHPSETAHISVGVTSAGGENYSNITAFPNPVSDLLRIANLPPGSTRYCLFNSVGTLLMEGRLDEGSDDTLDLGSLDAGIYQLVISSGNIREVVRILKL
jgi:hypothetical protein